jgi:sugar lactone lactonase YvrE
METEEQAVSFGCPKRLGPTSRHSLKVGADRVPSWPHDTPERPRPAEGKAFFLALKLLQSSTVRQFIGLILLSAAGAAAATSPFQLGVNCSEWLSFSAGGTQLYTDSSGATYFLTSTLQSNIVLSTVTKLTSDGKTLLWQNQLGFSASAMTVDPNGGVYVVPLRQQSDTTGHVAKLSSTGSGLAWTISLGFLPQGPPAMAADSQGRVYLAVQYAVNYIAPAAHVVRLNASGSAIDFTTSFTGAPISIALDPSGAAYIAGTTINTQGANVSFLAKVASDGTAGYYTAFPDGLSQTVAVDANGNVTVFGQSSGISGVVQRIDASGAVTLETTAPGAAVAFSLDAAGNAYVAAASKQLYPVKNSLATCLFDPATTLTSYSELLNVIAPDGSILQASYIPGGDNLGSPLLAVTPSGTVLVAAIAGPGFTPTQAGPFPAGTTGSMFLSNLSSAASHSPAPTYSLACAGSAASLAIGSISPGELVTLFGNGQHHL